MARDPNDPKLINIQVSYVAEMEGLLLRPTNGFTGEFTAYNDCQLKLLENGKCVTHIDKMYKPHLLEFQFTVRFASYKNII